MQGTGYSAVNLKARRPASGREGGPRISARPEFYSPLKSEWPSEMRSIIRSCFPGSDVLDATFSFIAPAQSCGKI